MARTHPEKTAFIFHKNNGLKLTFFELKERAVNLAKNFHSMGLRKGDRVALLVPNCVELVITFFACSLNGLIYVPLDQDYGTAELEFMIEKVSPVAIVVFSCEEFKSSLNDLFSKKTDSPTTKFASLKHLIFINYEHNLNTLKSVWNWDELCYDLVNKELVHEFTPVDSEAIVAIIFTVNNRFFIQSSMSPFLIIEYSKSYDYVMLQLPSRYRYPYSVTVTALP